MVFLGDEERIERCNLGSDWPITSFRESGLKAVTRRHGYVVLLDCCCVDRASILRTEVVSLAHTLRGIMVFPKHGE